MKVLGVKQTQQKTYNILPLDGIWLKTMGKLPKGFHGIVWGRPGNGKTEFCVKLAKELTKYSEVLWLSYEQGHGYDLQSAINRNKMEEVSGRFFISDPNENLAPGITYLQDLDNYLSKRGSPDTVFIDSLDYTRFNEDAYKYLKKRFKTKSFIWIAHGKGRVLKSEIGDKILFDCGFGIFVSKFIAWPEKSRFGGDMPMVIYEDRARVLCPEFFDKKEKKEKSAQKNAKILEIVPQDAAKAENGSGTLHLPPSIAGG